ncbi:MAG: hypothetical protein KAI66_12995, partial [Lentisphaeria bacterium]|nr:hypothetical protein [Lentisphaeria bacterium]
IADKASQYAEQGKTSAAAEATGSLSLGFDDIDHDGKFEYVVTAPESKVWISQHGTIARWETQGHAIATAGLGLCRDMIWIPQTERANAGMDVVMTLDERRVSTDRITLGFSKNVTLETLGGMASIRVAKTFTFPANGARFDVNVNISNTSVTMDMPSLTFSYRAHNYIDYGKKRTSLWLSDGKRTAKWDDMTKHCSIPNKGLTTTERKVVVGQGDVYAPHSISTFGDYFPDQQLLLTVRPKDASRLLQILRWGRKIDRAGRGTIEWMYKPHELQQGQQVSYEYALSLQTDVTSLHATRQSSKIDPPRPAAQNPHLLFHANFDGTPDAATPTGIAKATVEGTPTYESTPGGQGIRIADGLQLSFPPEKLVNLTRGKLQIRFKPLWDGTDQKTHYLLTIRPLPGFVYFGKIEDGRLLMNMFDEDMKQHYPAHAIRTMEANTWHHTTITWDAEKGTIALFLDGKKVGEHRKPPWVMGRLANNQPKCRLIIPKTAEAVIDDIKIWDRP